MKLVSILIYDSDHDSGLLRKILEGEKIELYTTHTIHESYKRKINAITGISLQNKNSCLILIQLSGMKMEDFYHFIPVPIGAPFRIYGAIFEFDYSFHTIPTLRFKLHYHSKSISYSSDTMYDPKVIILTSDD